MHTACGLTCVANTPPSCPSHAVEMARDLSPDIERLLENPNPYIRKKAALCSIRCVRHRMCVSAHVPHSST